MGQARTATLQFDDELRAGIAMEHLAHRRNAEAATTIRMSAAPITEVAARIELRELSGGELLEGPLPARGPLQGRIMMDHDHAIARKMDIELEAIRAERHPVIEGRNGVLGAQRGAAAMRVNDGHGRILACAERAQRVEGPLSFLR